MGENKPHTLNELIKASGKTPYRYFSDLIREHRTVAAAAASIGYTRQALQYQMKQHGFKLTKNARLDKV